MKAITMLKKVSYGFLINLNWYKQHMINMFFSCVFMKVCICNQKQLINTSL